MCGYYAGSSVFGALLGLAWSDAGWTGVAAGVGVLVALALVATAAVVRATAAVEYAGGDRPAPECQCVLSRWDHRVT